MSKKPKSGLEPIRKPALPKRNEQCPCGSGKKAKRCCLPRMKIVAALPPHLRTQLMVDHILQKPVMTAIPEPTFAVPETDIEKCTLTVETTETTETTETIEEVHDENATRT